MAEMLVMVVLVVVMECTVMEYTCDGIYEDGTLWWNNTMVAY
jgi:hypothetical protein